MKNYLKSPVVLFMLLYALTGCESGQPYFKHDISYDKSGSCATMEPGIKILANTIGERYSFDACLDADYDGSYEAERKGDTVLVAIKNSSSANTAYRVNVDINTRPAYRYIIINGNTLEVSVKRQ